jgi:signal transduction histidine kinase
MTVRVPWLLRLLVCLLVAVACFETIWFLLKGPVLLLNTLLFFSVYPLSSLVMVWVARLNRLNARHSAWRGWLFMAAIPLFMMGGDLTLYGLESQGLALFPSLASLFYVAIFPCFFLAYRHFSEQQVSSVFVWQRRRDVGICVLTITVYMWRFLYSPIALTYVSSPWTLAFFILSVIVLTIPVGIVMLTLWNEEPLQGVYQPPFIVGLLGYVSFIVLFFVQNHQGVFSTKHMNATVSLWILALYASSALLGLRVLKAHPFKLPFERQRLRRALPYLPYVAMVASFLLVFDLFDPNPAYEGAQRGITQVRMGGVGVLLGTTLITLLVIVRQIVMLRENHRLTRALQAISSNLEQRVEERTKQLEDSRARLAANERLASLGRISAGLAHEINTPVAAAMNSLKQAQHLAEEYEVSIGSPDVTETDHREIARELRQSLASTDSSLDRLGEFVRRMRGQVRSSAGKNDFEAVRVVKDSLAMLEHRARKARVSLVFLASEPVYFYGDATRFSQVVANLVVNALDACEENWHDGSAVTVSLTSSPEGLGLEVTDNGVGIAKELQEKIFEPLFTTKEVGKGTGLGLAIIQDIIYGEFDGRTELASEQGRGTTFRVFLPSKKQQVSV